MPVRLGLIGAGRWGRIYVRAFRVMAEVELVHCASSNPDTQALVGDGCRVSSDWRDLIDDSSLDAVVVAAPAQHHGGMVRAAVEKGLPILVEKPLTLDLEEAEGLLVLAKQRGALVAVDHIHLHNPAYEALKARGPALGPVTAIHGAAGQWGPFFARAPVLWEWGAHDASMCLDLMGAPPKKVEARLLERRDLPEEGGVGEAIELLWTFGEGVEARIELSNLRSAKCRTFTVSFGDCDLLFDDLADDRLAVFPAGACAGAAGAVPVSDELPLTRAVRAFAAAVSTGSRDLSSLTLGVEVVRLLSRCERQMGDA